METFIQELNGLMPFKSTTNAGDIVLIASHEPRFLMYACVTSIDRDQTKRDEWWHIGMTLLTVPPQQTTWTLRTEQMTGQEIFTMGGEKRFLKAIDIAGTATDGREMMNGPGEKPQGLKRIK